MDPDQTVPLSSLIRVHTVCKNDLKSQADEKADNCCDWQFKGKCIVFCFVFSKLDQVLHYVRCILFCACDILDVVY